MEKGLFLLIFSAFTVSANSLQTVIGNLNYMKMAGVKTIIEDKDLNIGYALLDQDSQKILSMISHADGRCGGFELLSGAQRMSPKKIFSDLKSYQARDQREVHLLKRQRLSSRKLFQNSNIQNAVDRVEESELREWVEWLSSFPNRYHKANNPNDHVSQLQQRLEDLVSNASFPVEVDRLSHRNTSQDSLRVRIQGAERPEEIIVLGGHLDSINQFWFFDKRAPGADDNASGSSNLLETLRILLEEDQPQRSVEFFWYAGEEGGLIGSAEIAENYKNANKDVVAVLQLDMTLRPGSGKFVLGSMTDFTSPWLRDFLEDINNEYIGADIIYDKCGYGCSDHASWYRQGFSTLMPFESDFGNSNSKIHTANDRINSESDFEHSAIFSKIAIAFALELANSDRRAL